MIVVRGPIKRLLGLNNGDPGYSSPTFAPNWAFSVLTTRIRKIREREN